MFNCAHRLNSLNRIMFNSDYMTGETVLEANDGPAILTKLRVHEAQSYGLVSGVDIYH